MLHISAASLLHSSFFLLVPVFTPCMMMNVEPQSLPINVSVAEAEQPLVWPWVGVLANIPIQWRNECFFGPSGLILKQHLTQIGFNPLKVEILWGNRGHSGFALVVFENDFNGYKHATVFEMSFQATLHGKRDWNNTMVCPAHDFKLYGWIAREDDYKFVGIVGQHLRKFRNLDEISNVGEKMSLFSDLDPDFVPKRMHHNHKRSKVGGFSDFTVLCSHEDMRKSHQYHSAQKQGMEMRGKELVEREVQSETDELRKIQNEKYMDVESLSQIDCRAFSLESPAYQFSQTSGNQFSFTRLLMDVESLSQIDYVTSSLAHPTYQFSQTSGSQFRFSRLLTDIESLSQMETSSLAHLTQESLNDDRR